MFKFIKNELPYIAIVLFEIIFGIILLTAFKVNIYFVFMFATILLIPFCIVLYARINKKYKWYSEVTETLENLDNKMLTIELLKKPEFLEGEIFVNTYKEICKNMLDEVSNYTEREKDYKEYIELFVHDVKTKIASTNLVLENSNMQEKESIKEELEGIEKLVSQILFYARMQSLENDYIIKEENVKDIIKEVLNENKKEILLNKVTLKIENVDSKIYTDRKWVIYVINQIIQNSIKYRKERLNINIDVEERKNYTVLSIKDNGIGIKEEHIKNIFEKGYTGETGRKFKKATGMGLYLAKNILNKMNHKIDIISEVSKGTTVFIYFPKYRAIEEVERRLSEK